MSYWTVLALVAGASIAIQAAMNARLGQLLNNSLLATSYAFFTSFLLVGVITLFIALYKPVAVGSATIPAQVTQSIELTNIPWYLWFSFVFSVIGVASFYFLIPKMGVGNMMSYALTGQLVLAMVISHFGLFNSPTSAISMTKLIGTVLLIIGIILINRE